MTQASSNGSRPVTTGVPALDDVLGGGIPRGAVVFVTGLPGAGKTILSEQALFANARLGESVLYVTTLSEPTAKLLHFTSDFAFFQTDLLERTVQFADLGTALRQGPEHALAELGRLIRERRPEFVVIDSFKVFREHFEHVRDFRSFATDLMILLATWETTALLVGEYDFADIQREPEFAIADGVIHLSGTEEALRQKRFLTVVKMRGADAFLGRHSFEIDEDGITVFPRMLPSVNADYPVSAERTPSCIDGLDDMLGGGIPKGSVALISGGTGSGKTLTAMSFAVGAASRGEHSLIVSFEESPSQLLRNADMFEWGATALTESGAMQILHISPAELDIDRHAIAIQQAADAMNATVVVIDSITAFEGSVAPGAAYKEYLWGIAHYFKAKGITLILTAEAYSFYESSAEAQGVSYLADTIILMRLVEEGDRLRRKINVLKVRGSSHDDALRELSIGGDGVAIVDVP